MIRDTTIEKFAAWEGLDVAVPVGVRELQALFLQESVARVIFSTARDRD